MHQRENKDQQDLVYYRNFLMLFSRFFRFLLHSLKICLLHRKSSTYDSALIFEPLLVVCGFFEVCDSEGNMLSFDFMCFYFGGLLWPRGEICSGSRGRSLFGYLCPLVSTLVQI
jgi:hypothetical protein